MKHRYEVKIPGHTLIEADVFSVDGIYDFQFAVERPDGGVNLSVVRNPQNVVVTDKECPESIEFLIQELNTFRTKKDKDQKDLVETQHDQIANGAEGGYQ